MTDTYVGQGTQGRYAGFWIRFVALLIDTIILMVAGAIVGAVFGGVVGGAMGAGGASGDQIAGAVLVPSYLIGIVLNLLYFTLMESSARQATIGKSVMGLIVTDMNGNRLSFANALGRWAGKILSSITLLIGYIMVAFTERKQGLHDLIASTLVVYR